MKGKKTNMQLYLYDDFKLCRMAQLTSVWWWRNLHYICGKMQLNERFTFRLHHFFVFYFLFKGEVLWQIPSVSFCKRFLSLLALLISLTKKRLTRGTFLSLVKSRKKWDRIFKCAKSNSFSKEMLLDFLIVEQQQPTGGTFYTKDEETR